MVPTSAFCLFFSLFLMLVCGKRSKPLPKTPVFYINMDSATERNEEFRAQMAKRGFRSTRVPAVKASVVDQVKVDFTTVAITKHTNAELACLVSHLSAIHEAVHDPKADSDHPYALIMEDDAEFAMDIDIDAIIKSAPKNFGILQLTTSNAEQAHNFWNEYVLNLDISAESAAQVQAPSVTTVGAKSTTQTDPAPLPPVVPLDAATKKALRLWKPYNWNLNTWSTQAYIINKHWARPIIDSMVDEQAEAGQEYKTMTIKYPTTMVPAPPAGLVNLKALQFRLVADLYLYCSFGPAFVFKLPVIVESEHGSESTIQTTSKSLEVKKSFNEIKQIINMMRLGVVELPSFIDKDSITLYPVPLDSSPTVNPEGNEVVKAGNLRGLK